MKTTIFLSLTLAAALPLAAQTTPAKPTVHHPTTTATHHVVAKSACSVTTPLLSPKIPALPATAPKCPSVAYQLTYIDITVGTGPLALPKKFYTVHYTGYLIDGTKFDSSLDRNEPITFPYGAHRVITGWDTGFEGMHVGGKRRLFVPYQLAYGEAGRPPVIPEKAELIFDVELIAQSDTPPAPKTPPTPPTPPAGTKPATPPATGAPATAPAAPGAAAPATNPTTPPVAGSAPAGAPATPPAAAPAAKPTTSPATPPPTSKP
jgi:peptidylprolyl isomerase